MTALIVVILSQRRPPAPAAATPAPLNPQVLEEQALALQEKGDYAAAEELFRTCLAERQRVLGPEHIDTLAAMNNLANLLHDRGKNAEAGSLHRVALDARERTLGPDHPHTFASLNNLALVLQANGDLAGAEPVLAAGLGLDASHGGA